MKEDLKHHPTQENETPPHHSQSITFLSYPNQKTLNLNHHHNHPAPPHAPAATYKECLKNHAAGIGGHAVDGCGEFMPEPTSFKCSACGCHRNFHRREPTTTITTTTTRPPLFLDFHRPNIPSASTSPSTLSPPSPPPQPTNIAYGGHLLLSLSTAADPPGTPVAVKVVHGRKRFRTKFSQEQKEKMQNFAEKVGWKMQRCHDKMVTDFCNDIGIKRRIFKVWMHNNKNTFGKKDTTTGAAVSSAGDDAGLVRSEEHLQDSTNGSSFSS
nr:hypothetical protein [Tanacetum cinerariifolium]